MTNEEVMQLMTDMGLHEGGIENWVMDNAWVLVVNKAIEKEREACAELKNILHPMNFGGKETYTTQELLDHMKTSIVDYSNAIRARGQA